MSSILEKGHFYAQCGPKGERIQTTEATLIVRLEAAGYTRESITDLLNQAKLASLEKYGSPANQISRRLMIDDTKVIFSDTFTKELGDSLEIVQSETQDLAESYISLFGGYCSRETDEIPTLKVFTLKVFKVNECYGIQVGENKLAYLCDVNDGRLSPLFSTVAVPNNPEWLKTSEYPSGLGLLTELFDKVRKAKSTDAQEFNSDENTIITSFQEEYWAAKIPSEELWAEARSARTAVENLLEKRAIRTHLEKKILKSKLKLEVQDNSL